MAGVTGVTGAACAAPSGWGGTLSPSAALIWASMSALAGLG